MSFIVLPTPYPAPAAVCRSKNCKVLSELCKLLALLISLPVEGKSPPSLRAQWPRDYLGRDFTHTWSTWGTHKAVRQRKVHVCVVMGFWRLGSCSPCQLAHLFTQGWATAFWSAFSVFCTDRCLALEIKTMKKHSCTLVSCFWSVTTLSFDCIFGCVWFLQFWLYFSDMHNCGGSCHLAELLEELWFSCICFQLKVVAWCYRFSLFFLGNSRETVIPLASWYLW